MGIPKFFNFINDRYRSIQQTVKEYEIAEYDNLYLDMNSIIHTCSHPSNSDVYFCIGKKDFSDIEIFNNVCRYVDIIFRIVKPVKLMFLAFDGTAPRAKMNQQRANRFRVAKNVNQSKGNVLNSDAIFDANCITPGTIFMAQLIEHVRHFILFKISTCSLWQKCKIILSGPEVPGEGEHKIMQFIRYNKSQPNYNNNTRHCLYCCDADLIILGLCTHEPFFSIIHEKSPFGKLERMLTPEESDFSLYQLSLLREYLGHEFALIKSKLNFNFDLENIIDDWILLGFLVGNDFVPQLPNLHIENGALSLLFQIYIKVLPTLNGYINEAGKLNLYRFEKFIQSLSHIESKQLKNFELNKAFINQTILTNVTNSDASSIIICDDKESKLLKESKKDYYNKKLKFENIDGVILHTLVEEYVRAIQWTLHYYYDECASWSWYYPFHYAPLISDLNNLKDVNLKFDDASKPFSPLQHLLAVLPPLSSHLLPESLRFLLTNENSPIIDFYPENFEIDLNGKINDWEAIVLIPFIDEQRLITAMEPYITHLTTEEQNRNKNGLTCKFTYLQSNLGNYPKNITFDAFINHAKLSYIKQKDLIPKKLVKGLCPNLSFNLHFPCFPTLKHIPHSCKLQFVKSKMINRPKVVESMFINVLTKPTSELEDIAKKLLGQKIYINWPNLRQAYVIGVTDFTTKILLKNFWTEYSVNNLKHDKLPAVKIIDLKNKIKIITNEYKQHLGINIGKTKIIVYVFPMMGKRYVINNFGKVKLEVKWSSSSEIYPYQLIVNETCNATSILYRSVKDIFQISNSCFIIGHTNYGALGEIKRVENNSVTVAYKVLKGAEEPNFTSANKNFFDSLDYLSGKFVAKKLKVNIMVISRITGSLKVFEEENEHNESKYHDIGLRMKFPKNNKELFDYTTKIKDTWYYSNKAIEIIESYVYKFPDLFKNISKNATLSTFKISDLFPEGFDKLNLVKLWLAEQKSSYTTFLECGTKTLGHNGVPKLEKFVSHFISEQQESEIIEIKLSPSILFRSGMITGLVPPDAKAEHKLLDRIVSVKENFTVPLGFKGTIIGIQEKEDKWKNIYEILFDNSFADGLTLYGSSKHKCYRLTIADFINISFNKIKMSSETKNNRIKK